MRVPIARWLYRGCGGLRGVGGLAIKFDAFVTPIRALGAYTGRRTVLGDLEHHWFRLTAVRQIYRRVSWEICGKLRCPGACVGSHLRGFLVGFLGRHVESDDELVGCENGRDDHVIETLLELHEK